MKNIFKLTLICVILFSYIPFSKAQPTTKPKPGYLNFNFTKSKLKMGDEFSRYNDYGGAISVGRTFYLHQKPVSDMIRFGLF